MRCQQKQSTRGQNYLIYSAANGNATGGASPVWAILIDLFGCQENVTRRPFTPFSFSPLSDEDNSDFKKVFGQKQVRSCLTVWPVSLMLFRRVWCRLRQPSSLVSAENPSIALPFPLQLWLVISLYEDARGKSQLESTIDAIYCSGE